MKFDEVAVAEGSVADLVLFDPAGATTFSREFMRSKASNTPFLDQTLDGSVDMVLSHGDILLERDAD